MRILIITFTTGVNPGTFMQALGVQTAMKKIYPDAKIEFLDFPDFKRSGGIGIRGKHDALWHTFLQKGFAAYRLLKYRKKRKEHFSYSHFVDMFNYTPESAKFIEQYDLVVIGSDTILEQAYAEDGTIGLNWMPLDVKKIYFATSASPANFELKDDRLKNIVSAALFIGLRDDLTICYFRDKLNIEPEKLVKQPDPTFYLEINKFELSAYLKSKIKQGVKHALYNFNSNFPYRKELADELRGLGYKIVSTAYNPYADICFDTVDAFEWAGVFPLMDIIVTERFHDSIFGLRNCKPVIAVDWDKNRFSMEGDSKTFCILSDYGLSNFHFNLCLSSNLAPICDVVSNIDSLFNIEDVKMQNIKMIHRANDILKEIEVTL